MSRVLSKIAFVTGSSGFVGRHACVELKSRGWTVLGVDLLPGEHTGYMMDMRQYMNNWHSAEDRFGLVVHCAFHVGGRAQIDSNKANLAKNLELDAAMFSWAVRTKQPRVLYFSSSAVYPTYLQGRLHPHMPKLLHFPSPVENPNDYRLQEGDADIELEGTNPSTPDADYGFAKLVGERLAENAMKLGVKAHIVRPFSGYSETQSLEYPFPSIVKRAREGDLTVWGPPNQARDWLHVDDLVAGALAIVDADYQESAVNLCTGRAVTMGELAKMVFDQSHHLGFSTPEPTYDETKPTGVLHRVGDPTLFHEFHKPRVSLEEGIRRALKHGDA